MAFKDPKVAMICANNFDTDGNGYLTMDEVESVTSIKNVFAGNTEIEYFPELKYFSSITKLGDGAFTGCTALKEVGLENITEIWRSTSNGAFYNSGVEIAVMPKMQSITGWSFRQSTQLHSVYLGADCSEIGSWAFNNCSSLTTLVIGAIEPPTRANNAFDGSGITNGFIYVPNDSVGAYKTAWTARASLIKGISELPTDTEFYNKIKEYLI